MCAGEPGSILAWHPPLQISQSDTTQIRPVKSCWGQVSLLGQKSNWGPPLCLHIQKPQLEAQMLPDPMATPAARVPVCRGFDPIPYGVALKA